MKSNAKAIINKRLVKALQKTLKDAPKVLGLEGQKMINENFKTQSYEGKKWAPVKSKKKKGPILIGKTRVLVNAARRAYKGFSNGKLTWSVDGVPYAKIHNNGGYIKKKARQVSLNFRVEKTGLYTRFDKKGRTSKYNFQKTATIGAHGIKMPKRQFIGASQKFVNRLKKKFEQMLQFNLR